MKYEWGNYGVFLMQTFNMIVLFPDDPLMVQATLLATFAITTLAFVLITRRNWEMFQKKSVMRLRGELEYPI